VENEEGGEPLGPAPAPAPVRRKRKILPFVVLGGGALIAAYLASRSPHEQHVNLVLGAAADQVTGLEVQYVAPDGDVVRTTRMTFEQGRAPRVVSHQPELTDGDYRLRIDLDTREGRRSVERRVTLHGSGGGTTQVDLSQLRTTP
jgi:hypothetical protein